MFIWVYRLKLEVGHPHLYEINAVKAKKDRTHFHKYLYYTLPIITIPMQSTRNFERSNPVPRESTAPRILSLGSEAAEHLGRFNWSD